MTPLLIAHSLIDQLIQQGVLDFCIAPGSRSTPLALAAARHPKAHLTVHFDERGLGFYALGTSIAHKKPAALIVTSGTAVGNLLPAVMEAYHSRVPLLLLTADRPPELRDCSANQTTDQIYFFQKFVLWQTDLPCSGDAEFFRSQASYAFFQALRGGPVHLNCPFREPLFEPPSIYPEGAPQLHIFPKLTTTFQIPPTEHGLILMGQLPYQTDPSPVLRLAQQVQWPVFSDLLSSTRAGIKHFDALLHSSAPIPDLILHFGGKFVSKTLIDWIKKHQIKVIQVSSDPIRKEPLQASRIWSDLEEFCSQQQFHSTNPSWLECWNHLDQKIETQIQELFAENHPFTEPDLMRLIGEQLPNGWSVFLGNSMPIRDAGHFLFPKHETHFFANRGLSGIDGQIATAVGIAVRTQKPMCAILGDQSCLHDLNSLPLLHTVKTPFLLVISNNFGGGIFSHLPVAEEQEHFERLFGMGHQLHFEQVANMFQIPYQKGLPLFPCTKPSIVELCTSRKQNTQFRKQLQESFSMVF